MNDLWWIKNETPALILAPMEGVTDYPMREFMSEWGGFTHFVTEFFRISESIPKLGAFKRHFPELKQGAKTKNHDPVQLQILGGNAEKLLLSAQNAIKAGFKSIDLNFGCPVNTVNNHDGGAALLKDSKRIKNIVHTLRSNLPKEIPVSAKFRLGWDNHHDIIDIANLVAQENISWITIHGRSKIDGYKPFANWNPIKIVRQNLKSIPVIANGDIFSFDDFRRCQDITECTHFMIGRGALANPNLSHQIAKHLNLKFDENKLYEINWEKIFLDFSKYCLQYSNNQNYLLKRLKQWISLSNKINSLLNLSNLKQSISLDNFLKNLKQLQHDHQLLP
jgi:tRNA-dihydrouridine synthase C